MCKRINIFFPCYMVFYIVASIMLGMIMGVTGVTLPTWAQYFVSEAVLLTPPLIYILIFKINVIKCLPIRKLRISDALLSLLTGYLLIPLVLFINSLSMLFVTNYLNESQSEIAAYPYLFQLFLMAVMPPLVEEFVFRGIFYHSYRRNGILGAALMSGLIFGTVHMNINQFCYAIVMGVVFALMVEATGSLWSSVLAHFAINSFSITVSKLVELYGGSGAADTARQSVETQSIAITIYQLVILGIFAALFTTLAFLLYRTIAIRNNRWGFIVTNVKKGLRAQNGEHFITIPAAATFVAAFAVMIFMEFAQRL